MEFTAELVAETWELEQEISESEILPKDMLDTLDQELAELERSLKCPLVNSFYADKTSHLEEEEADAWAEWYAKLNNGDGGIWSELSDRMEALYDAEECYAYDCYRLAVEQEGITRVYEEERYQRLA